MFGQLWTIDYGLWTFFLLTKKKFNRRCEISFRRCVGKTFMSMCKTNMPVCKTFWCVRKTFMPVGNMVRCEIFLLRCVGKRYMGMIFLGKGESFLGTHVCKTDMLVCK